MMLGQVRAALRPSRVDVVELREVLMTAEELGFDAASLYLEAKEARPLEYEPAPPLAGVLPDNENSDELETPDLEEDQEPNPEPV